MLAIAALTLTGCTQVTPYRTRTIGVDTANVVTLREAECVSGRGGPARVDRAGGALPFCEEPSAREGSSSSVAPPGEHAVQRRHYSYAAHDGGPPTRQGDYYLSFVEFDDQGWFADRKQMEALFMLLHRIESGGLQDQSNHPLIILYAHGWKHNASPCDDNVVCFSRLLERMDILERHAPGDGARRPVVGVYVGWRGLSLDAGALTNITFWTRKGAAERVGRGGVSELLNRLNDYRRIRNERRDPDLTQLIVTGHSFGGLVIYSSIAHALMERAGRIVNERGDAAASTAAARYAIASGFGDLVVLVNPAFEGSLYEPLFHVATNRCYGAEQRPVMLTVTSSADEATGTAFPFGRWFSTRFENARSDAQDDSIRQAVGHDARYETHRLKWTGPTTTAPEPASSKPRPAADETACGCPYLEPTESFKWQAFLGSIDLAPPAPKTRAGGAKGEAAAREANGEVPANVLLPPSTLEGERRVYRAYGRHVELRGDVRYSANYPYLVVKADREVIEDHNSIYNEPFIQFLHAFFAVHIANRRPFESTGCVKAVEACELGGLIPCEASCRLPTGGSCSGRTTEDVGRARPEGRAAR